MGTITIFTISLHLALYYHGASASSAGKEQTLSSPSIILNNPQYPFQQTTTPFHTLMASQTTTPLAGDPHPREDKHLDDHEHEQDHNDQVTAIPMALSLVSTVNQGSTLYSPPPLTHHLDYKSKTDIRRAELETEFTS